MFVAKSEYVCSSLRVNMCVLVVLSVGVQVRGVPMFSGQSFLQYPGLQRNTLSFTEIEIVFKPMDVDGLILYNGFSRDRTGDFIDLAMKDGYVEYRFDLGTGPAVIR